MPNREDHNPMTGNATQIILKEAEVAFRNNPDISVEDLQWEVAYELYHQDRLDGSGMTDDELIFIAGVAHMFIYMKEK